MNFRIRFATALWASSIHLLCSLGVVAMVALLVFFVWYPYPYGDLSEGRSLFFLLVSVDVVCGPLLTLVLFNKAKPRAELKRDLGLVVLIQLLALAYGVSAVWQARPLFLVYEIDRFKVVAAPYVDGTALAALPAQLAPTLLSGPITVGVRELMDLQERNSVLFESVAGGRDYAERPEFYMAYGEQMAVKALNRAKPLSDFLRKYPIQQAQAQALAKAQGIELNDMTYLPVIARQDWIALLDSRGQIKGFLKGDGF